MYRYVRYTNIMHAVVDSKKYTVNEYLTHVYIQGIKYIPSDMFHIHGDDYIFLNMIDIGSDIELEIMMMKGEQRGKKYYVLLADIEQQGLEHVKLDI